MIGVYWQEDDAPEIRRVPDDVVDLVFAVRCRALPVDHQHALREAVLAVLPWLAEVPGAGIHPVYVAASGNGWMRPETGLLYPSRRTKLVLRLPKASLEDARALAGRELDIDGHRLQVGDAGVRLLSPRPTVFSRYVIANDGENEENFLAAAARALETLGIRPRKMLPGRAAALGTPAGPLGTRSLMLADLKAEESIRLQQAGLGPHRLLGCGIFVPHKGIASVED